MDSNSLVYKNFLMTRGRVKKLWLCVQQVCENIASSHTLHAHISSLSLRFYKDKYIREDIYTKGKWIKY